MHNCVKNMVKFIDLPPWERELNEFNIQVFHNMSQYSIAICNIVYKMTKSRFLHLILYPWSILPAMKFVALKWVCHFLSLAHCLNEEDNVQNVMIVVDNSVYIFFIYCILFHFFFRVKKSVNNKCIILVRVVLFTFLFTNTFVH